jgi:hypothetical protein
LPSPASSLRSFSCLTGRYSCCPQPPGGMCGLRRPEIASFGVLRPDLTPVAWHALVATLRDEKQSSVWTVDRSWAGEQVLKEMPGEGEGAFIVGSGFGTVLRRKRIPTRTIRRDPRTPIAAAAALVIMERESESAWIVTTAGSKAETVASVIPSARMFEVRRSVALATLVSTSAVFVPAGYPTLLVTATAESAALRRASSMALIVMREALTSRVLARAVRKRSLLNVSRVYPFTVARIRTTTAKVLLVALEGVVVLDVVWPWLPLLNKVCAPLPAARRQVQNLPGSE